MDSRCILSVEECKTVIKKFLGTDKFSVLNIKFGSFEDTLTGYMSDRLKIEAEVQHATCVLDKLTFFVKTIPRKVPLHAKYVIATGFHRKEYKFYSELVPDLTKYQSSESGRWAPKCYLAREDTLVLEDLLASGFKIPNIRDVMTMKECSSVVTAIARYHAGTIVFEEKESMRLGRKCRMNEIHKEALTERSGSTLSEDDTKGWFQAGIRSLIPLVFLLPKYKENLNTCKFIVDNITEACNKFNDMITPSNMYRNVVCHGDLWTSNIFVRYNGDAEITDVRFVDFQIIRYAAPAQDVIMFLHLCTDKNFREKHKERLLSIYYKTLAEEISGNGLNPEELLPFSELLESFESMQDIGRFIAVLCMQITLMESNYTAPIFSTPERFEKFMLVDRSEEICHHFITDEYYRHRLNEAMEEFIDCCILRKT